MKDNSEKANVLLDYIENDLGKKQYVQALQERESAAKGYLGKVAGGAIAAGGAAYLMASRLPTWAKGGVAISSSVIGAFVGHKIGEKTYEDYKKRPREVRAEMHRIGRQVEALYADIGQEALGDSDHSHNSERPLCHHTLYEQEHNKHNISSR